MDAYVVGKVIQRLREQKGKTQEVLSGLAGIGRTHLSAIERGTRKPTLETFSFLKDIESTKKNHEQSETETTEAISTETDETATETNRNSIITERENTLYTEVLEGWQTDDGWKLDEKKLEQIKFKNNFTQTTESTESEAVETTESTGTETEGTETTETTESTESTESTETTETTEE